MYGAFIHPSAQISNFCCSLSELILFPKRTAIYRSYSELLPDRRAKECHVCVVTFLLDTRSTKMPGPSRYPQSPRAVPLRRRYIEANNQGQHGGDSSVNHASAPFSTGFVPSGLSLSVNTPTPVPLQAPLVWNSQPSGYSTTCEVSTNTLPYTQRDNHNVPVTPVVASFFDGNGLNAMFSPTSPRYLQPTALCEEQQELSIVNELFAGNRSV